MSINSRNRGTHASRNPMMARRGSLSLYWEGWDMWRSMEWHNLIFSWIVCKSERILVSGSI